jgi:hypothetical protein
MGKGKMGKVSTATNDGTMVQWKGGEFLRGGEKIQIIINSSSKHSQFLSFTFWWSPYPK